MLCVIIMNSNHYIIARNTFKQIEILSGTCNCQTCLPNHPSFDQQVRDKKWAWYERVDDKNKFSSRALNCLPTKESFL